MNLRFCQEKEEYLFVYVNYTWLRLVANLQHISICFDDSLQIYTWCINFVEMHSKYTSAYVSKFSRTVCKNARMQTALYQLSILYL